jgi:hypothetical protein
MVQLIKSIETIREIIERLYICFMSLPMLPLRPSYGRVERRSIRISEGGSVRMLAANEIEHGTEDHHRN